MYKKEWKKNLSRMKQLANQGLGRSEKSEVLTENIILLEKLSEELKSVLRVSSKALQTCLAPPTAGDHEKRLKKVPEFGFSISLLDSSKTLDDVDQQNVLDVFSKMLGACANVEKRLAEQYIEMSDGIDNKVIQNVQTIVDKDLPALIKVKNQLTSCILDLDTAKTKLKNNNQQIPSKVDALREEVEQAEMKMEQCRDTFETEVYSFFSREAEFCGIFLSMLEQQANYHRQCSEVFDRILPTIKQDIVSKAQRPVFGCSLTEHLHYTKREIAVVIEECVNALTREGIDEEGVFRLAPSTSRVKKLRAEFDANMVNINEFIHDAACLSGVLKQYLRELPEPLMLHDLCEQWVQAYQKPQSERLNALWVIVDKLKQKNIGHYNNLRYLIKFLALVASHSEKNKMSSANLAIVVAPNLLWPPDNNRGDVQATGVVTAIVEILISSSEWFFPGEIDFASMASSNENSPISSHRSCNTITTTTSSSSSHNTATPTTTPIHNNNNNSSNNVNNNHHQPSQHNSFAVKEAFLASKPSSSSSSSSHDVFATSSGDPFPRALRPPPPTPIKNPPLPPHSKRKGMAPLPPSMTSSDPGWVGNNHQRSLSTSVNLQGEIAGDKGANNRFAVINGSLASSSTDISTSQLSVASSSASNSNNNNNNKNNNSSINRSNNSSENAYQTLGAGVMGVTNVGMAICGGKELTSSHKPDDNNNVDDVMDNNNYSDITDNNDSDVTHGVVKRKGKIKSTTSTVNRSNNTNVLNRLKEINNNNNNNNNVMNDGNETDSLAAQWKDVLDYDNAESDMIDLDGDDDEAAGEGNFVRNRFVKKAENVNNKFVKNVAPTSSTSAATATQPSTTSSTAAATTSSSSSAAAAASSSSQMSMSDNCAVHSPAGDADVFHPLPDASASSTGLPQQQPQQNQQHQLQQKQQQQQQSLPYFFISTDTTATTISTSKMSNNFNSDNKNNNNSIDNSQQTDEKRQHRPQQHTTITKPIPAPRVLPSSSSTTTTTTSSSLITSASATAAATTTSSTSSITSSTTSTNVVTSISTTASSSTPQAPASTTTTTTTTLAITNQSKLSLHPITSNNKDDIIIKIKKDDNDDYDDYLVENVTKL